MMLVNLCEDFSVNIRNHVPQIIKLTGNECYEDIFQRFLEANQPCIFGSELTAQWGSRKDWVHDGTPNKNFLIGNYGSAIVPIANCEEKYFDSQMKRTDSLANYFGQWKDEHMCLYLKDWHFMKQFPEANIFQTPKFFASDWLNEFWQIRPDVHDDYRFVYIGPKGSWTPLHADVFRSFSWSSNICGKKRWLLFPPGQEKHLYDCHGNLLYDLESPESMKYQWLKKCNPIEIIQERGETIFVPSGWHHQVWNLEDTISINHNWINGTNIDKMWTYFTTSLNDVQSAISDCIGMDGWANQCQKILKSTFGMDLLEYVTFLKTIAYRRIAMLNGEKVEMPNGWNFGEGHIRYDLKKLRWSFEHLINDIDEHIIATSNLSMHPSKILEDIEKYI